MTTESEVIKPVIQVLREAPDGELSTTEIRRRVKERLRLTETDLMPLANRNDFKIDQTIRNLKSHRDHQGNPFNEGFLEDIPRGFRLTEKGRRTAW